MTTTDKDLGRKLEDDGGRYADERAGEEQPAQIERDIDATRADVRATLAALERRLSFDRLVEMTVGRVRERGGEFAANLSDAVTQNPIPLLLTSLGVGWLMLSSRQNGGPRAPRGGRNRTAAAAERMASAAGEVGDHVHGAVDSSREALGHAAESLRAGANRAAVSTREQVDYARERMDRLLNEQPLMLGALGLAAGALIGALLPTTEAEDRFIGEARDKAVAKATRATRDAYETVREHGPPYAPTGADDERPSRPH